MPLAPHQQRVVHERDELFERRDKLTAFLSTPTFATLDAAEKGRLQRQATVMGEYIDILNARIAAFYPA